MHDVLIIFIPTQRGTVVSGQGTQKFSFINETTTMGNLNPEPRSKASTTRKWRGIGNREAGVSALTCETIVTPFVKASIRACHCDETTPFCKPSNISLNTPGLKVAGCYPGITRLPFLFERPFTTPLTFNGWIFFFFFLL